MTKKKKIELEEELSDIYYDEYVEELLEHDEITPEEEAFMLGYNEAA